MIFGNIKLKSNIILLFFYRMERSRTVIPALFEASMMASEHRSINMKYFYDLLFTTVNLKLVHIVCHDKGQHDSAKCNPKMFLKDEQVNLFNQFYVLVQITLMFVFFLIILILFLLYKDNLPY